MEKHITYKEEELKATLRFMESSLKDIQFWLNLMGEQVDGKRENIELSDYKNMVIPCQNIKRMLSSFNVA